MHTNEDEARVRRSDRSRAAFKIADGLANRIEHRYCVIDILPEVRILRQPWKLIR
jgi:hypothetical protein